jgi:hypothetical protein
VKELVAIVSGNVKEAMVPLFKPDETVELVNLIEERFLRPERDTSIVLIVNGTNIRLNRFTSDLIKNTILGMVSSLRGAEHPDKIILKVNKT